MTDIAQKRISSPHVTHSTTSGREAMKRKVGRMQVGRYEGDVWAFLRSYMLASQGQAPTTREIQAGTGLSSPKLVQSALIGLEHRGLIRRSGFGRARDIRIVKARYILPDEPEEHSL